MTDGKVSSSYGEIAIVDVSPESNKEFSKNVAGFLGITPHNTIVKKFADGETDIIIADSVRGKDVYLFQTHIPPLGERKYEVENAVNAMRQGGLAKRITAVFPYCFGMRGDRATRARQCVQAGVWAKTLKSVGIDQILTIGLHTETICTIFDMAEIKVEHLAFEPLMAKYIIDTAKQNNYSNIVIASPDVGGAKRVRTLRKLVANPTNNLKTRIAIADKYRYDDDKVEVEELVGDVKDKVVFPYDDIGGTLGTFNEAINLLQKKGARAVYGGLIHGVLATGYETNLDKICSNDLVKEIVFGNTIPLKDHAKKQSKVKSIELEPLIAEAIKRMNGDMSISELHNPEKIIAIYDNYKKK